MRAFFAIPLPERLRRRLVRLGKLQDGLRVQAPDTIHLTIRFLGLIEDPAPVLAAVAPVVAAIAPFEIELAGLGAFPHWQRARVVWGSIRAGRSEVMALAAAVEAALAPLGFARERQPFRPHVTIGRYRHPADLGQGPPEAHQPLGPAPVNELVLYESTLLPAGPEHRAVGSLSLATDK